MLFLLNIFGVAVGASLLYVSTFRHMSTEAMHLVVELCCLMASVLFENGIFMVVSRSSFSPINLSTGSNRN